MFKKYFKWLPIFIFTFVLGGCSLFNNEEPVDDNSNGNGSEEVDGDHTNGQSEEDEQDQDVATWMPRLDDVIYSFEGVGNEFATFSWTPQFNQDNYYQIVKNNGGTIMAEIYEYREDEVVRIFTRPETYFRDNFHDIGSIESDSPEEVVLKAPIAVGTTWSGADSEYEITAIDMEITVPAGTYQTIEVTQTYSDSVTKRYYARDVGLVYEHFESDGLVVESSLDSIATDTPEAYSFIVYVPDAQAMGMDTVDAELKLYTNDPARVAISELLSGQNSEFPEINILPEGTEINYLFLNNENIVEVDVSEEFEQMNAGSTGELFTVYTLVNTLAQYYGTQEVLLTVDGAPYEGGHIALQEGETFLFNEDMVN